MDLDFLIVATPFSLIREILLGTYKINLSNIDAILTNPAGVVSQMTDNDAFAAAKIFSFILRNPTEFYADYISHSIL